MWGVPALWAVTARPWGAQGTNTCLAYSQPRERLGGSGGAASLSGHMEPLQGSRVSSMPAGPLG